MPGKTQVQGLTCRICSTQGTAPPQMPYSKTSRNVGHSQTIKGCMAVPTYPQGVFTQAQLRSEGPLPAVDSEVVWCENPCGVAPLVWTRLINSGGVLHIDSERTGWFRRKQKDNKGFEQTQQLGIASELCVSQSQRWQSQTSLINLQTETQSIRDFRLIYTNLPFCLAHPAMFQRCGGTTLVASWN